MRALGIWSNSVLARVPHSIYQNTDVDKSHKPNVSINLVGFNESI